MLISIEPSKEQIDNWIKRYVPKKDLYFLKKKDLFTFKKYLNNVLIIPEEEFFKHSSYKQIQLVNSFEYWKISKDVQFILVADSNWFSKLPVKKKKELNAIQVKMDRGLILPLSLSSINYSIPKENIADVNDQLYLVLQSNLWGKFPYEVKVDLIKQLALKWDNWTCYEITEHTPHHLKKHANTFPSESGSNCLSSTLFAISKEEWIIDEWVHPKTFLHGLKNAQYFVTNKGEINTGDVVTWENQEGIIQHASYHIGNNLFFNKDGQTFFNPWKIVSWTELESEWNEYRFKIYRRNP